MKTLRLLLDLLETWLLWIFATSVSWSVGLVAALAAAQGADLILPQAASVLLGGAVGGAVIGLIQWLALRPEVQGVGVWTLAAALGWTAALLATALVVKVIGPVLGVVGGVAGGCVFGFAQWLALRPGSQGRGEWALMTVLGWTVVLALGLAIEEPGPGGLADYVVGIAASGAVGLVAIGIIAMLALLWLFPRAQARDARARVGWWT